MSTYIDAEGGYPRNFFDFGKKLPAGWIEVKETELEKPPEGKYWFEVFPVQNDESVWVQVFELREFTYRSPQDIYEKPFPSWVWSEEYMAWVAPVKPDPNKPGAQKWDEESSGWVDIPQDILDAYKNDPNFEEIVS
jgi:hypothetical protein